MQRNQSNYITLLPHWDINNHTKHNANRRCKPRPGKLVQIWSSWVGDLRERSSVFWNTEAQSDWSVSNTTNPPFFHHHSVKPPFSPLMSTNTESLLPDFHQNPKKLKRSDSFNFQVMKNYATQTNTHTAVGVCVWVC